MIARLLKFLGLRKWPCYGGHTHHSFFRGM